MAASLPPRAGEQWQKFSQAGLPYPPIVPTLQFTPDMADTQPVQFCDKVLICIDQTLTVFLARFIVLAPCVIEQRQVADLGLVLFAGSKQAWERVLSCPLLDRGAKTS